MNTPRPWKQGVKHPGRVFSNFKVVAYCTAPEDEGSETKEEKANARLITASPDLLEACKTCKNYIDWILTKYNPETTYDISGLDNLIAKAEGK